MYVLLVTSNMFSVSDFAANFWIVAQKAWIRRPIHAVFRRCPVQKRGRFVMIGCAILLCYSLDMDVVARFPNHDLAYQATVVHSLAVTID